jgi:hypothetical protein
MTWRKRENPERLVVKIVTNDVQIKTYAYVHDPSLPPRMQGYRSILPLSADRAELDAAVRTEFVRVKGI